MRILNPIYDLVFKLMMQDERISRFFISTLINEEIVEIEARPQEYSYHSDLLGLQVYRLDFSARIKTPEGNYKNVVIEIQKAQNAVDLMRFRNYLAEQYKKEEEIKTEDGKLAKMPLPIITIYLLGFSLAGLESSALKVNREYIDLSSGKTLKTKHDFIEKLTHDSYVVQIPRLQPRMQTRLDKLLSLFIQANKAPGERFVIEYPFQVEDSDMKYLVDRLQKAVADPDLKRELEGEEEARRLLEDSTESKTKEYKKLIEKVSKEKEEERRQKEEAIRKQEEAIRRMASMEMGIGQIAGIMQLPEEEVKRILDKK